MTQVPPVPVHNAQCTGCYQTGFHMRHPSAVFDAPGLASTRGKALFRIPVEKERVALHFTPRLCPAYHVSDWMGITEEYQGGESLWMV